MMLEHHNIIEMGLLTSLSNKQKNGKQKKCILYCIIIIIIIYTTCKKSKRRWKLKLEQSNRGRYGNYLNEPIKIKNK